MLKRKTAETLPVTLRLKGQGETVKFNIVFNNLTADQLMAKVKEYEATDEENSGLLTVLAIVNSWETEYDLSVAGLKVLEGERPGTTLAILEAYYAARRMTREKN